MADLEMAVNLRESGGEDSGNEAGRDSVGGGSAKQRRSRKHRNLGGSEGADHGVPAGQDPEERRKEDGSGRQDGGQQADSRIHDLPLTQEDHRARFYEHYHKEAKEYDRGFVKKYDEDLNTTLIFAGLFSAMASAFIIDINSKLQPNRNDETTALLRVLIHKIDNTTFGNDPPILPQWTGPPRTIVHVQTILFASHGISALSAFLAMLGKQWLIRYASTDVRGSAIERSQNRQRKFDGIATWYFDYVIEALSLMLQAMLLLFGCALSLYYWEINTTIMSVILGVTSFGLALYIFIVVAGTASESCPYQTPGSRIFRHTFRHVLRPTLRSVISKFPIFASSIPRSTWCCWLPIKWWSSLVQPWYSTENIISTLILLFTIPVAPVIDAYRLVQLAVRLLVDSGRAAYCWFASTPSPQAHGPDQETIVLGSRCISWILQTSLDKAVHLSTLKYLATMTAPTNFDPPLIKDCLDVVIGCINAKNHKAVITQGLEELTALSAMCCLHIISHLSVMDPLPRALEDIYQRYTRAFPPATNFNDLPTLGAVHWVFHSPLMFRRFQGEARCPVQWEGYNPSDDEYIIVAHALMRLTRSEYRRRQHEKVPRWLLRFALHSLSRYPLPPTSVVVNCLAIVAIDLGYDSLDTLALDESVHEGQVSSLIIQALKVIQNLDQYPRDKKRKCISALLPYAILQERHGRRGMLDALLDTTRPPGWLMWARVKPFLPMLFNEASHRAIVLMSPHVDWRSLGDHKDLVHRWAVAASTVPYTEVVGQSVVDTLLHIASIDSLRPHIPASIWAWLEKRPSLPPVCLGRSSGTKGDVVRHVRSLGDIEILKAYFLLVWSEWGSIHQDVGLTEMQISIREDFSGIGMGSHREDLIKRLGYILEQLDRGLGYSEQHVPIIYEQDIRRAKEQYTELKEALLEVDGEAVEIITRTFPKITIPPAC